MYRLCVCAVMLAYGVFLLSGGLAGQEVKQDPKSRPDTKAKKDDTPTRGTLPKYWGQLGLSDEQRQAVYKLQAKYGDEITKLEAKVKELKATRDKQMKDVLSEDQKKRLVELIIGKDR